MAVVVDSGKADVLKGQVAQLVYCAVHVECAGLDLFQELFDLFFVNRAPLISNKTESHKYIVFLICRKKSSKKGFEDKTQSRMWAWIGHGIVVGPLTC